MGTAMDGGHQGRQASRRQTRRLGLVGGMSWPSTGLYYQRLNRALEPITGGELPSIAGARLLTSDRRLDLTRASRELGYQPKIDVREAVRRTADWYRQQGLLAGR